MMGNPRVIIPVCAILLFAACGGMREPVAAPAPASGRADTSQVIASIVVQRPQVELPGFALDSALFQLREMDMHIHCGYERPLPLSEWVDLSVRDGRKVLVTLDHLELYRKTPEQYAAWVAEEGFRPWYEVGAEGRRAFMEDMATLRARKDVIAFRGWEIFEGDLEREIEPDALAMADVVGFHISPNNGRRPPDGESFNRRIRQILDLQKTVQIPMILFHPFTMRYENLQRTAQQAGRDVASITAAEYRFFTPEQQEETIRLLRGSSISIEIGRSTGRYWENAACREAFIADIRPLAEAGVQFIVSTDAHGTRSFDQPFDPESYCAPLGVTPRNTNGIVRELLAIRARRSIERTSATSR